MTPERWVAIERLYHEAFACPANERARFLDDACVGDEELRREVESLLAQSSSAVGFLSTPAAAAAAAPAIDARAIIGRQLGPYVIQAQLGAGGMGEVYRARDTKLGRDVAVKILPPPFTRDAERLARFEREARILASLNHPHIGAIYGLEHTGTTPALVLELVGGHTLDDRLRRGPIPVPEALTLARQIADAVEAAHEAGIVHRDLKPANIKITPAGVVKVLDFGLAKLATDSTNEGSPSEASTLTAAGTKEGLILGTAAYMSPEQACGRTVDKRTDIWAFGCVLYEMLTAVRAFRGANVTETLAAVIHDEPDWSRLPRDLPPAVLAFLQRTLQKDVSARIADIRDVRLALQGAFDAPISVAAPRERRRFGSKRFAAVATVAAASAAAAGLALITGYFFVHRPPPLTDRDTIVLADFTNTTGDPVFDGTLRQGLAIQLEQSPFLSLVADERIQRTLQLMGRPLDAPLSPALAKEVCERTASAAVLEGSIVSLGSQYVVGLRAKRCRTGEVLDEEQAQAPRKEEVLDALSRIAIAFRTRVGESLATIKQHDTPLEEATTPSLEALRLYSAASKSLTSDTSLAAAVPLLKEAIEKDPKFAMAYASLGFTYLLLGEPALSVESNKKAFELRDRASDREKFFITANYELQVTGNLENARQICERWLGAYPREKTAHGMLGAFVYPTFGQYEKGVEVAKQLVAIDPDFPYGYLQLAFNHQFAGDVAAAENALQRASDRKLEVPELLIQRYDVAFLKGDQSGMEREVSQGQKESGAEDMIADRQAFVWAYSGRLEKAKSSARHASDLNQQPDQRGRKASIDIGPALWDALFGEVSDAKKRATAAANLSSDRDVQYGAAFALALSGETSRARSLANDLDARFPEDSAVQFIYLPQIRALLTLHDDSTGSGASNAIELLQRARPYELGIPPSISPWFIGPLYTIYARGLVYLEAQRGPEAAAEFQNVLDHRSIVVSDPIGALAHLQLGRAFALSGDATRAKEAYEQFFALWKNADADIAIFQKAKAEYTRLE
jgi:tetratricopeptide (TPR) repeat protein